jgi:hypothetical protein
MIELTSSAGGGGPNTQQQCGQGALDEGRAYCGLVLGGHELGALAPLATSLQRLKLHLCMPKM